jgi:cobalt-zinc-cadmium efflux system membrane fusion protein
MTRRRTRIFTLFAGALFATCAACKHDVVHGESNEGGLPKGSIQIEKGSPKVKFIKIETLQESDAAGTVQLTGRVTFDEDHTQRVSTPLDGRVTAVLVKPGDKVTLRQRLVLLSSPFVGQLQSDAQRAQQDLVLAQKTVDRAHKLKADGAISEKEVVQVETDLAKAKSAYGQTTTHLSALGVSATDPAVSVALYAQVAGTVVERNVLVGQEVRADAPLPLVTVSNLDTVWVFADVYEQDLGLVQEGGTVGVRVPAYPAEVFPGTIGHLGEVLDPLSRTVKLRCVVPNPGARLKPEMFAKVELTGATGKKVIVVPSKAILSDTQSSSVVVAGNDDIYTLRKVEIGGEVDGKVRVLSGLKAGERVVTDGAIFLKNEIDH